MSKRIGFMVYSDWREVLNDFDDKTFRELMDAIFDLGFEKKETETSPVVKMVMKLIRPQILRDWEKYEKRVEHNRSIGIKGGRPKTQEKPNGNSENPVGFTETQRDMEKPSGIINKKEEIKKDKEEIDNNTSVSFDTFWDLYDKKVDRGKCEPKWNKLSERDKIAALEYIPKYKEAEPRKAFRRNPETFLNNRSWENELIFREEEEGINTGKIQKDGYGWKV